LFPGLLGELDIELVKQVRLGKRVVPPEVFGAAAVPRPTASNNWVLSGAKTASGQPMLANDPHLEGNRLPCVWSEIALHWAGRWAMGATMPGGPGILIGRTPDVAWGVTYAFTDAVDSWIERCRDGRCFREPDGWRPFQVRRETILRKRKKPFEWVAYENEHGVLDGDPNCEGLYMATRWTAADSGGKSFGQILKMLDAHSVSEGMDHLGQVETAWSWVLADRQGNIGFQMSGLAPRRREGANGFVPLPGWKRENDWQGFVAHADLPRSINPEQGYLATANQDLNALGRAKPINVAMAPCRAERIARLLEVDKKFTPADMFAMHFDVYSPEAEAMMNVLRPLLPDTPQGRLLADWDLRYTLDSRGAFLFEEFYRRLLGEVFGRGGLGETAIDHLSVRSGIFTAYYDNFDRVLLAERSAWFGGRARDDIYRSVAAEALCVEPRGWGHGRGYMLRHLLFGGKLPAIFGFDRGPVSMAGGRATIHQVQSVRSVHRTTTVVPSFRMVADMAADAIHTTLAGGPSDRRFSPWYCSDLADWAAGRYKIISPDDSQEPLRFP
jgi:penicillin G amidase